MFSIPDLFLDNKRFKQSSCLIKYYESNSIVKNAITKLTTNAISFLLEGEKQITLPRQKVTFDNSNFIVLKKGHCLMSEKKSNNGDFKTILLFFDLDFLFSFYKKYDLPIHNREEGKSFALIKKDDLLNAIANSLLAYFKSNIEIPQEVSQLKLEEILLQIVKKNGSDALLFLLNDRISNQSIHFHKVIEDNIYNNLTVKELSFLCNMSSSTFRRHFIKTYKMPPAKWMTIKRLEKAAELLKYENAKASEIFLNIGFDSLSGFIQSFKKQYGVTPKQFQTKK